MSAKDIIKLRKKLNLTQAELAKAFGLAGKSAIFRWEAEERSPGELVRRLVCFLNDLSKAEAEEFIQRLSSYAKKRQK